MCNISDRFKEDEKYFDKIKFYDLKEKEDFIHIQKKLAIVHLCKNTVQ